MPAYVRMLVLAMVFLVCPVHVPAHLLLVAVVPARVRPARKCACSSSACCDGACVCALLESAH
eukprot:8085816-Alexandrium_andersonii.AAC.1